MTIDFSVTLKALKNERAKVHQSLANLDTAIAALEGLSAVNGAPASGAAKRTMSAAARKKIALAQKLRWAKVKQATKK